MQIDVKVSRELLIKSRLQGGFTAGGLPNAEAYYWIDWIDFLI